jgi:hypothetical protein
LPFFWPISVHHQAPFLLRLMSGDFRVLSQIDLWGWGFGFTTVWFLCCYEEKDSSGSNDKYVSYSVCVSLSLFVSFGKRYFCCLTGGCWTSGVEGWWDHNTFEWVGQLHSCSKSIEKTQKKLKIEWKKVHPIASSPISTAYTLVKSCNYVTTNNLCVNLIIIIITIALLFTSKGRLGGTQAHTRVGTMVKISKSI